MEDLEFLQENELQHMILVDLLYKRRSTTVRDSNIPISVVRLSNQQSDAITYS